MRSAIFLLLASLSCLAQVAYTLSGGSVTSLTYNGTSWNGDGFGYPYAGSVVIGSNSYGFLTPDISSSSATKITHVYRNGLSDSFTVEVTYTAASDTLTLDFVITNNSTTGDMTAITLGQFGIQPPTPTLSDPPASTEIRLQGDMGDPIAYLYGASWSFAAWNANLGGYGNFWTGFSATGQTNFIWHLTVPSDIVPGQRSISIPANGGTWTGQMVLRFSSSVTGIGTLAETGYSNYRTSYPYSSTYADRRHWAEWFTADHSKISASNPRGYWSDAALNALDPATFAAASQAALDGLLNTLSSLSPKPQGVILWDIEGQEFPHAMTYIGNPSLMPVISPEMDPVADSMVAQIKAAGYKIGFTLRPMKIVTGTTLPATCTYNATYSLTDKYIKTDATPPNRGYVCTATDTWTQLELGDQMVLGSVSEILDNMRAKINYAIGRWGASAFYVDSTVNYQGYGITTETWRTLQSEYPSIIMFPENDIFTTVESSAPFGQAKNGSYGVLANQRYLYPMAFAYTNIQDWDGVTELSTIINGVANGDMLSFNGWYSNVNQGQAASISASAAALNATVAVTDNGKPRSFVGHPGTSFTYPLVTRVYFAANSGALAASTTYCTRKATDSCYLNGVLQPTAALDLTGMTVAQLRYYDFAGNLVADAPAQPLQ